MLFYSSFFLKYKGEVASPAAEIAGLMRPTGRMQKNSLHGGQIFYV